MYENLLGLSFKGAAFSEQVSMKIFPSNVKSIVRSGLIYGKNGSGKSTLSKAVMKTYCPEIEEIDDAFFFDKEEQPVVLSEEALKHIFVFNEDYTERNVQLKSDGLDTIVMFGEQGDLEEKIKIANSELNEAIEARKTQEEHNKKYSDVTAVTAPKYYIAKMIQMLKGDDHWAGRERIINGTRTNASVKDHTYEQIIATRPTLTLTEIRKKFDKLMKKLQMVIDESGRIQEKVPTTLNLGYSEQDILSLLATLIQKPELTDREKILLSMVERGQTRQLDQMQEIFGKIDTTICPFCMQSVSLQYKENLVESIQKVLSKAVDAHRAAIKAISISPITIDFAPFSTLNATILEKCENNLAAMNSSISDCLTKLIAKDNNVYQPITGISFNLEGNRDTLVKSLIELEQCRVEFNKQFDAIKSIRSELHGLNSQMAYFEILDFYNAYVTQNAEAQQEVEKLSQFSAVELTKRTILNDLLQQKKSVRIAVDVINQGLQYVFFSKDRLHIKANGNTYSLTSNGQSVRPADVSSGERNILSLCYFFAEIGKNLERKDSFSQECLLVIDDPVSSFDLENRIGILSFLKFQLSNVLSGNMNTKVLILTHDLPAFYDIEKIMGEIKDAANSKYGKNKTNYSIFELTNKTLIDFRERKRHEYSELLNAVYEYAAEISIEYDLVIGNIMRRTLEAFSTFEYRKGMNEISCDEKILASMNNPAYRTYFQNLMYRLVLNGESHMEERVKSLTDMGFSSNLTPEEKRQTAKDILCLIRVLNNDHIEAHLADNSGAIEKIDDWCEAILAMSMMQ